MQLALGQGFDYPEQTRWLDQYIFVEDGGTITSNRNWFQDFDRGPITADLTDNGFEVLRIW